MRRLLRLAIVLALLLLIAGHFFYWYSPRERAAAPEPGSLPARLLAAGAYNACLWLPYPHQNLGKLEEAIGDGPAYLAAVAGVANLPAPVMPSFGPFAVPPSREIVACSDFGGDRFLLVARVYPAIAAVARLAGRIADNPWLRGGEVRETRGKGNEVEERVLHIAWRDGFWTVRAGDEAASPAKPALAVPAAVPESLGILHLQQDVSDFPAGEYVLRRNAGDLEVTLAGGAPAPLPPIDVEGPGAPVLLAVAGPAWPADAEKPLPPAAMVLFDAKGGLHLGPLGDLPGLAVLNPPGERRWGLPARGLAALLADNLPRGNAAGWSVVALDDASLERAQVLAPRISGLVPPAGDGAGSRLILGLWLRPRPSLRLISEFRRGLEKIPLVDRRQVARWRDWETLLAPVGGCERASLAAARSPSAFLLRLHGCG
ncbi:MAG TPA: hypothetical protein VGH73_25985 [Thermoanaerobaculia bacterium]